MLLAAVGGALGLAVAEFGTGTILAVLAGGPDAASLEVSLNGRVLLFAVAVATATGIAFGLVPALRGTRADLTPSLCASGRAGGAASTRTLISRTLLVAQIALAVVVLAAAGLLGRSLIRLESFDAGFNRESVVLIDIDARDNAFPVNRLMPF